MRTGLIAALLLATPAAGHVVLDPGTAAAGSYFAGRLRIGHGCGAAATTVIRVELPTAATNAKPQPKPGWTVTIEREGGRVTALRWEGLLPPDQFDEFGVMFKLDPGFSGALYLPTVQRCGGDERRWTDIPAPGAAWTSVPAPAPVLTVGPAAPEHAHH